MFLRALLLSTIACLRYASATTEGLLAERGMFSYAAALTERGKFICGGTIVSKAFIVTAAHCFKKGSDSTHIQAIVGTHDLEQATSTNIKNVSLVIVHPRYSRINKDFDIALVRLEDYLILQHEDLQAVSMVSGDYDEYYGYEAIVLGWGHGREGNTVPPRALNYAHVQIWDRRGCTSRHIWGERAAYIYGPLVSERMLCVSLPDLGPATCDDDDGSALLVDGQLLGVLSWRYDCHSIRKPSVYTSLAILRSWMWKVFGGFPD